MSGAPTPRPPGTCPAPSVELVALTRCPWAHQDDSSDVRRDRISTSSNPWTPTPSTLTLAEWLRHSGDGDGDGTCAEWTTAEWDDRRMGRPPNGTTAEWEDRRVVARGMGNVNRRVPDVRDVVSAPFPLLRSSWSTWSGTQCGEERLPQRQAPQRRIPSFSSLIRSPTGTRFARRRHGQRGRPKEAGCGALGTNLHFLRNARGRAPNKPLGWREGAAFSDRVCRACSPFQTAWVGRLSAG